MSSKTYRKVLKKFWSRSCWQTLLSIRRFRLETSQEVFLGNGKRNQNAEERCQLGSSQYHLAAAGGCEAQNPRVKLLRSHPLPRGGTNCFQVELLFIPPILQSQS